MLDESGIESLTALKVAEKADISVASFYQYFPNVKAVIVDLYKQWLSKMMEMLDELEKENYLKMDMASFFTKIGDTFLQESVFSKKAEAELFRASDLFPVLRPVDQKHSEAIADRIAKYLVGYGSNWPRERLRMLGLFLYKVIVALQRSSVEQPERVSDQFKFWGERALLDLIRQSME